ncbi:MAG: class I SAM-dependent methyltransferase [Thermoleophilaceae bacterium]|nr:class I SAM-dependent methyltransferase [Thermoleophilaceae bacterium]
MGLLADAWMGAARLRRRSRRKSNQRFRDERTRWVRDLAPGRSFADIGCLWNVHGEIALLAEEAGASRVTAFDAMDPTPEFEQARTRRGSSIRFVQGDLHDPSSIQEIGEHDIVWCTGVIYHSPDPFGLVRHLRAITGQKLRLGSHVIPEVPGIPQASVFYPGLDERGRAPHRRAHRDGYMAISTPFDPTPGMQYANYWWGLTPSALGGMLDAAGFAVERMEQPHPFYVDVIARPR